MSDTIKFNCFKVTSPNDTSCSLGEDNPYVLKYIQHTEVFPKIGKIFVFDKLEMARDFAGTHNSLKIWKAFGSNLVEANGISVLFGRYSIYAFWYCSNSSKYEYYSRPPKGSLWCDSLTLIEEVDKCL